MIKVVLKLSFPAKLVKKPVMHTLVKKMDVKPNILAASVTPRGGKVTLEITGRKSNVKRAVTYLKKIGVKVLE
ncbi:MAG: NIL domain-containing protein [Candidatus Hydrogenedentota bacterium]